jgi:hypothetical protein
MGVPVKAQVIDTVGVPGRIRTCDRRIRNSSTRIEICALALLRARRERPRGRAAEQRHELALLYRCNHSITSSARASTVDGIHRLRP